MSIQKAKLASAGRVRLVADVAVIGWREWLALPTLGVARIKAKIDSGARTSSLHAFNLRTFTDRGAPHVAFVVHTDQRRREPAVACTAQIRDERMVTSSSGHRQRRYVIEVDVCLGDLNWPIEVTLADRDAMGFRMLLGREAIRGRFLVNSDRSFIAGRSYADVSTVSIRKTRSK